MNPDQPTMLMGIDTRLSTKKEELGRVGVVASTDNSGLKYRAFVKVTDGFGRYSTDMNFILKEAFEKFEGKAPTRLLIYRAGMNMYDLSHGEAISECNKIRDGLNELYNDHIIDTIPKIAYIGYNRANNIRFMRTDEPKPDEELDDSDLEELSKAEIEEREKTKYNVPIGTVIDTQIVDENSFYLITHCAVVVSISYCFYARFKIHILRVLRDQLNTRLFVMNGG